MLGGQINHLVVPPMDWRIATMNCQSFLKPQCYCHLYKEKDRKQLNLKTRHCQRTGIGA